MSTARKSRGALQLRFFIDIVAVAVCVIAAVIVLGDLQSAIRPPVVLVGLVIGLGWGLVGWIDLPLDAAYVAGVTVAVGAAVSIVVSVVMVETAWWHPVGMVAAMLVIAAALNVLLLVRDGLARERT